VLEHEAGTVFEGILKLNLGLACHAELNPRIYSQIFEEITENSMFTIKFV
jgi:hypothetical protein